jgi:hypothetical protein
MAPHSGDDEGLKAALPEMRSRRPNGVGEIRNAAAPDRYCDPRSPRRSPQKPSAYIAGGKFVADALRDIAEPAIREVLHDRDKPGNCHLLNI